jgi:hypothetical protein
MSSESHCPGVWSLPELHRVLAFPSIARAADSPVAADEAVATQPALGSADWADAGVDEVMIPANATAIVTSSVRIRNSSQPSPMDGRISSLQRAGRKGQDVAPVNVGALRSSCPAGAVIGGDHKALCFAAFQSRQLNWIERHRESTVTSSRDNLRDVRENSDARGRSPKFKILAMICGSGIARRCRC